MKARSRKQAQVLKELENNPLIERACKKVGIARSTYYRWIEADPDFMAASEMAQEKGRMKLTDFVESKLLENINNNQQPAIAFWLSHNTMRYRPHTIKAQSAYIEKMYKENWIAAQGLNHLIGYIGLDQYLKHLGEVDLATFQQKIDREYEEQKKNKYKKPEKEWYQPSPPPSYWR